MRIALSVIAVWFLVAITFLYLALAERIVKGQWPHWLPTHFARIKPARIRRAKKGGRGLLRYRRRGAWSW